MFQLTVRKNDNASSMPTAAAARVNNPSSTPRPAATSPKAISNPVRTACCPLNVTNPPIGDPTAACSICARTPNGDTASR